MKKPTPPPSGAIKPPPPPAPPPERGPDADRLAEIERKLDRLTEAVDQLTADRETVFRTGG